MKDSDREDVRVFHASPSKSLIFAGGLWLLVAFALLQTREPDGWPQFFWIVAVVAAVLSVLFILFAVRRLPTLTLTKQGVELLGIFGTTNFSWSDFEGFAPEGSFIKIWFSLTYRAGPQEGGIANQYTATTDEICRALSSWRIKYSHDA